MTQVFDVIVVGCGAAGIAALTKLHQENLQVLGLEASSKIGGRICTRKFGENSVELGAQWCHGEKNNIVYTLVKDMNILYPVTDDIKSIFVKSNSASMDTVETDAYLKLCSLIKERAEHLPSKKNTPLSQCLREEFCKEINSASFAGNRESANEILEWYLKSIQTTDYANELLQKSKNSLNENWNDKGEQLLYWKDKGFKIILDVLLHAYPNLDEKLPIKIEFNKEVTNIKWKHSPKSLGGSGTLVQLQCKDGSLFAAKHVIVSVSLGVLKDGIRYNDLFTPSLPDEKILSIRSVAMCTMNKIYMKFPKAWWPHENMKFCIVWQGDDRAEFIDEDDWLMGVYEISTVEKQPGILCALVVGTAAENMELCSSGFVLDGLHRLMNHFIRGYGFIEKPTEILRSTWYTNSLTRGSFSYRSIETECVDKGADVLAQPLISETGIPIVCFAGEATSIHNHHTVHGAVESGFREADRLISLLK